MPWLHQVQAVLEAWYPGEQDGAAAAALLTGDVAPSGPPAGHLPDLPATRRAVDGAQWPGTGLTSTYSEGLDVGYRYDHATGTRRSSPSASGCLHDVRLPAASVTPAGRRLRRCRCRWPTPADRAGHRRGAGLPDFPWAAGEPPASWPPSPRDPGRRATRTVTLHVPGQRPPTSPSGGRRARHLPVGVGDSSATQPTHATLTVVHA